MQTLTLAIKIIASPDFLSKQHTIKKAVEAIGADIQPGDTLFAFGHHLIYWCLGRRPMSRVLHPGNLYKRFIMEPLTAAGYVRAQDALGRILVLRPTYLVTMVGRTGNPVPECARGDDSAVHDLLADRYRLFYDDRSLYSAVAANSGLQTSR